MTSALATAHQFLYTLAYAIGCPVHGVESILNLRAPDARFTPRQLSDCLSHVIAQVLLGRHDDAAGRGHRRHAHDGLALDVQADGERLPVVLPVLGWEFVP